MSRPPAVSSSTAYRAAIRAYLEQLAATLTNGGASPRVAMRRHDIADTVFGVLTRREFCYLSKKRAAHYYDRAVGHLRADASAGRPLRFYYDIGAGYHASTRPDHQGGLSFEVGLGELCILGQVASFNRQVTRHYAPGVEFHLVIDNVCGLLVNDIPVERTAGYCARLRHLIEATGMAGRVSLLVESEHFEPRAYGRPPAAGPDDSGPASVSIKDVENVSRFLGRPCDASEAQARIARYADVLEESDRKLEALIHGVHMTQRATPTTLGFRPFAGADSRIQVGEVVLTPHAESGVRPMLLTSRNATAYELVRVDCADVLPAPLDHVTLALRQSK